ncbi:signal peptidase II [Micromonospora sp. NBC_01655]|uniref:signal peptidase II n=1 Tax=Micromonospora sp. NBC_01655 TaxID=2975983 RepID=UPI00225344B5|nr:signal peptidase II [Micromonospora sp. NBC_01655]MCX4472654.1 signal peptidase II [Micromonospora sp. NBC_01655]
MFRAVVMIAAVVLVSDQVTKYWAQSSLSAGQTVPVVGELLQLRLVHNPGAAFSIGSGHTWVFTIVAAAAVVVLAVVARRVASRPWAVALGMVLGGAATHLLDRLFREPGFARGHVVDFIDYAGFFVGNVADIALVVGVGLAMLLSARGIPLGRQPASAEVRTDNS